MIKVKINQPSQVVADAFQDADGNVYLDLDSEFELRLTKVLEQLTVENLVTQEAALSTSIPRTGKNRLILQDYEPDADTDRPGIEVTVTGMDHQIDVDRLRVLRMEDRSGQPTRMEIELYGGGWIDDLELLPLNEIDLGTIEYLLSFVLAGWADNTALVVAAPADYGFFNTPGDLTRKDLRFKYNLYKLMRQAFCDIGWNFKSPFFEVGPGAHYYGYLNKDRWYDYSNKDSDWTVITNRPSPITYTGAVERIEFNEVKDFQNQYGVFAAGPLFTYANPTIPDAPLRIRIENLEITVKANLPAATFKLRVLHQKGLSGAVGSTITAIAEETIVGRGDQDVTRSLDLDIFIDSVGTSFEFFFIEMSCEDLVGNNSEYVVESGVIRYMPMFKFYVEANTITINELLRDDISSMDLFKAMAHLCKGMVDTNHASKTVTLYSPFDFLFDGNAVEGYFQRTGEVIELTNSILVDSRQVDFEEQDRKRFVQVRFANPSCAYIASSSDEEHPYSKTFDLGSGLSETEDIDNPLFEPSLEVFTPSSAIGGDGLYLPAHWNNTEGNESNEIGIRIGYHHGLTTQENQLTGNALEFVFEGTTRTTFGYITQDPTTNIEGTSPYHRLIFSDDAQDLFELCYRRFLREQFSKTQLEFLIWLTITQYTDFDFRKAVSVNYDESFLIYQVIALRDFAVGSRLSTPILMRPLNEC